MMSLRAAQWREEYESVTKWEHLLVSIIIHSYRSHFIHLVRDDVRNMLLYNCCSGVVEHQVKFTCSPARWESWHHVLWLQVSPVWLMASAAGWWWELQKQCRPVSDPSRSILPIKRMKVLSIKAGREHPSKCNCWNLLCRIDSRSCCSYWLKCSTVSLVLHRSFLLCSII